MKKHPAKILSSLAALALALALAACGGAGGSDILVPEPASAAAELPAGPAADPAASAPAADRNGEEDPTLPEQSREGERITSLGTPDLKATVEETGETSLTVIPLTETDLGGGVGLAAGPAAGQLAEYEAERVTVDLTGLQAVYRKRLVQGQETPLEAAALTDLEPECQVWLYGSLTGGVFAASSIVRLDF